MVLLPVVERELRVAARKRGTYWLRFFAALAVTLIWICLTIGARNGLPLAQLGHHLFNALGVLALGFCMLAGVFLTADCLSEEKRGGTLGLLFLTDLKGYDVVLGKLVVTSVQSFYGLLAIFPILALPLLLGGVTGAEFWRVILVLMSTLFFSLAVGMLISAVSDEARQAMAATFLVLLIIAGILPSLWWLQALIFQNHNASFLLRPSPGYAYRMAFDYSYQWANGPAEFRTALQTLLVLGFSSLALASFILPRAWQEKRQPAPVRNWREKLQEFRFGDAISRKTLREGVINANPFYWLAIRDRMPQAFARITQRLIIPLFCCFFVVGLLTSKKIETFIISIFTAYALHQVFKCLVAIEASRRFSEDRHSGGLELLLVTPIPPDLILSGQWRALQKHFRKTILLMLLVNLGLLWFVNFADVQMGPQDRGIFGGLLIGGMLMALLDVCALSWVGMWMGLRASRHHRATLGTLGRVMGLPWLGIFLLVFVGGGKGFSAEQVEVFFTLWFILGIVTDLVVGISARTRLRRDFRHSLMGSNETSDAQLVWPPADRGGSATRFATVIRT